MDENVRSQTSFLKLFDKTFNPLKCILDKAAIAERDI